MRAQFEAWIIERGFRTREQIDEELEMSSDYFTILMSELWAGWQLTAAVSAESK